MENKEESIPAGGSAPAGSLRETGTDGRDEQAKEFEEYLMDIGVRF